MCSADNQGETIPKSVRESETGVYEWLKSRNFIVPCPFESRTPGNERLRHLADLIQKLGFRYRESTLENYEVYDDKQRNVIARLGRFAETMPELLKGGGGLMLFGDPGTGKDHIVAALG
jgi:DNA replication protein DnaC